MAKKILVTGNSVRTDLLQPLREAGHVVVNPQGVLSEKELKRELSDTSAYLFGGDEFASRAAISSSETLKHIAFLGVGYESFMDVAAANERGILITNTPGTLMNSVAEFTIAHLLNSTRKLVAYANAFSMGQSGAEEKQHDLAAMHVGIVGLGAIGTRIAEILRRGFGSRVSYYSRTRKPHEEERLQLGFSSLADLASDVDALIVMTPGNENTRHLVSERILARAKPGLILINTAREEVVDPKALLSALKTGQVGYASFDGFYQDSGPQTKALKRFIPKQLTVTGHIASLTHEARDGMAIMAIRSILNILATGDDENIVNRKR